MESFKGKGEFGCGFFFFKKKKEKENNLFFFSPLLGFLLSVFNMLFFFLFLFQNCSFVGNQSSVVLSLFLPLFFFFSLSNYNTYKLNQLMTWMFFSVFFFVFRFSVVLISSFDLLS